MPMNRVQFQKGLSRPEFMDRCGTEEQCELALSTARWPGGFVCPACGVMHSRTSFRRDGRLYWQLQAMVLAESDRQLSGRVGVDDANLGGERSGGKGGRGTQNLMASSWQCRPPTPPARTSPACRLGHSPRRRCRSSSPPAWACR